MCSGQALEWKVHAHMDFWTSAPWALAEDKGVPESDVAPFVED